MQQSKLGVAEVRLLFRSIIMSTLKGLTAVGAVITLTLFAGSSAYASPIAHTVYSVVPLADPNLNDFYGCPSLTWVMPLAPTFKNLTGNINGVILLAVLALFLLAGIGLLFAGRDRNKAEAHVTTIQNVAKGAGWIFIAVPIIATVAFSIASAVCK